MKKPALVLLLVIGVALLVAPQFLKNYGIYLLTYWLVFTIAEATPANCRSTPRVAVCIDAGMIEPIAKPRISSGGSTLAA